MFLIYFFLGLLIGFILTFSIGSYILYLKLPTVSKAFKKWLEFYRNVDYDAWEDFYRK